MNRIKGFTLVELVVVVVIIGLFSAVARPFYNQYQTKVARADVQAEMLGIAQQLQAFNAQNGTYTGANPLGTTNTVQYPTVNARYSITLTVTNNTNNGTNGAYFELKASPIAKTKQAGDGVICLNQKMQKYWVKGATSCSYSNTSTWYGES